MLLQLAGIQEERHRRSESHIKRVIKAINKRSSNFDADKIQNMGRCTICFNDYKPED